MPVKRTMYFWTISRRPSSCLTQSLASSAQVPDSRVVGGVAAAGRLERVLPAQPALRRRVRVVDHDAHRGGELEGQHLETVQLVERELHAGGDGVEGADRFE